MDKYMMQMQECADGLYDLKWFREDNAPVIPENENSLPQKYMNTKPEQRYERVLPVEKNNDNISLQQGYFPRNVQMNQRADQLVFEKEKNQIEIEKKGVLAQIETVKTEAKEKIKSDVAEQRKFQMTNVIMQKGKRVQVIKERFGSNIEGILPLGFVESIIYIPYGGKTENGILYGMFTNELGREEKKIYFLISELDDAYIRKKFKKSGIIFGFSHEKETEIKNLIVKQMYSQAIIQELPHHPGWNEIDGNIDFIFPEQLTWKEVLEYVK